MKMLARLGIIAALLFLVPQPSYAAAVVKDAGGSVTPDARFVSAGYGAEAFNAGSTSGNRTMIAYLQVQDGFVTINSLSYAGVGMTLLMSDTNTGTSNMHTEVWGLANPATGSNNLTISVTGSGKDIYANLYAFANTDGLVPTLFAKSSKGAGAQTATVTALGGEYCTGLAFSGIPLDTGYALTGDASSNQVTLNAWVTGDSNGTVSAGSRTATVSYTSGASQQQAFIACANPFVPVPGVLMTVNGVLLKINGIKLIIQ